MPSKIWNKYKKIEEFKSNSNIKTYLTRIDLVVKEIIPKNIDDYYAISERLEELKEEFNIYEIIEEDKRIYIVMDNNEELLLKIDNLILSDELNIKKERIIQGHGRPITKDEIFNLFKMEKSMCKISCEKIDGKKLKGSGFFCEIDINNINFPFKYALFTNNHILNESNIEIGNIIHFECLEGPFGNSSYIKKKIKITEKRRVFTNKELDYTCIELFKSDNIIDYFKIDPKIFKYDKKNLKDNDIFILQYPKVNDLSFSISYGTILSYEDNKIIHNGSTDNGSSGSPIIRRSEDNYIIGLHCGGKKNNKSNLATSFNSILYNIKEQNNEINCIYISKENEIKLLHDYNLDVEDWGENGKKEYLNLKNINKKIFEENIEIYVNGKKTKFDYKYKIKESKEIKVKFKFKKLLTNISYMFYGCSSLKSIDLSSFITNNISNISYMFSHCFSLKSIDLSSFNTTNVNNMSGMFYGCSSLTSIDLSSFNTTNVNNMSDMFYGCSSLESIDLSPFKTNNVNNMSDMFCDCSSLESIDLSSFNTTNVNNMSFMFYGCSSLEFIDLSSFNTTNVNIMSHMFYDCSSLESIDLSSFNTTNVNNMSFMLYGCSSLRKENIKIKDKNEKLLQEIENYLK